MKNIESYKIFEQTMVDKKIQLLEDLSLQLSDIGLTIEIWKKPKRIVLLVADDNDQSNLVDDNYYETNLYDQPFILEFEKDLKSYGMNFRSKSGGGDKVYYEFDKWSKMTDVNDIV